MSRRHFRRGIICGGSAALVIRTRRSYTRPMGAVGQGFLRSSVSGRSKDNFFKRDLSVEVVVDIHELSEGAKASTVSRNAT